MCFLSKVSDILEIRGWYFCSASVLIFYSHDLEVVLGLQGDPPITAILDIVAQL